MKKIILFSLLSIISLCVYAQDVQQIPAEAVDLGLSVKWASYNIGATKPEECGDYFAWGETETKVSYDEDNYTMYDKYRLKSKDYIEKLQLEDDVANKRWGEGWRIPTIKEFGELMDKCIFKYSIRGNVAGCTVIGPNGNTIFLPFAGAKSGKSVLKSDQGVNNIGIYRSGTQRISPDYYTTNDEGEWIVGEKFVVKNRSFVFYEYNVQNTMETEYALNYVGIPVRAVYSSNTVQSIQEEGNSFSMKAIDLGLSVKWAECNLGAVNPEDEGELYAWGETKSKQSFTFTNYFDFKEKKSEFEFMKYNKKKYTYEGKNGYYSSTIPYTLLDPQDDAAHVNLGGNWQMPTKKDFEELLEECTWKQEHRNGIQGYLVTGPNGNSIFLPKYKREIDIGTDEIFYSGDYWTRSVKGDFSEVYYYFLKSDYVETTEDCEVKDNWSDYYDYKNCVKLTRCDGKAIRAVCP